MPKTATAGPPARTARRTRTARRSGLTAVVLVACATLSACPASSASSGEPVVQPGAPGQAGRVLPADRLPDTGGARYTEADVRFMQGMIEHHAQALRMTALVAGRGTSGELAILAERIEISQRSEIGLMQGWLRARLKEVPSVGRAGHGHHGGGSMPGMLTEAQFAELERARGAEFDRLFCTYMIYHHTGALRMVERLLAGKGGEQPEIRRFASHVDSDQRVEIDRLRNILASISEKRYQPAG
ncbi:DUF305 domain-containing protein [Sphaerimonospora sp. CA-214678]|uniref:DUF305 domain-containing protein n=1 Tax=Sphaerimonospora sp. CA-214678 TaxID=3240029 RepID=UPI003D9327EA